MPFDFSKVARPKSKPTDPDWSNPVSFFYKLTIDRKKINDLYPIQRDILKNWFETFKKNENDKVVALSTGTGKTLIGLMVAESIRRDSSSKVVYACPNTYLAKQVTDEANKLGIPFASYIKNGSDKPTWDNESSFLQNNAICITTYSAVLNPLSIFKGYEIKGVIFDDAHTSFDLLEQQFSIRSKEQKLIKEICNLFKTSPYICEKIDNILENSDPNALIMIPPFEWHTHAEAVKSILNKYTDVTNSFPWINIKEKIDRTFCFISLSEIEIGFLYPDIKNHYIFQNEVHRVYLSATLPNLDDITRVFGFTPSRIELDTPDYRPQRLFIFPKKTALSNPNETIKTNLKTISSKTLVLAPSHAIASTYKNLGATIPTKSEEVPEKIKDFRESQEGILVLANRYDGIDIPGDICHCLVVDELPYTATTKTRFFSEYFRNHKNSLLRSTIASKLIQAFGRTIRAHNDYSIIFILGSKLNSWIINKDNQKFFKADLYEDVEIGMSISESITTLEDLRTLSKDFLQQTSSWKDFYEERKSDIDSTSQLSPQEEQKNIRIAQKERKIHNSFMSGDYTSCLRYIIEAQNDLEQYSKPILGLYLSMGVICCSKINDSRISELSSRSYSINPIFGSPVTSGDQEQTLQAHRIIQNQHSSQEIDWSIGGKMFDENLKKLGELLGFNSRRPEIEEDGTLDVCWEDEERKIVFGFENNIDKENETLTKQKIDQCHGHMAWLEENYPNHEKILFVVGEFTKYHAAASPSEIYHTNKKMIENLFILTEQVNAKKNTPNQIDPFLDENKLRMESLFIPRHKVSDLPKEDFKKKTSS